MQDLDRLPLPALFGALTADGCLARLIDAAIAEDLAGAGDITSQSIIAPGQTAIATLVAREGGIAAGLATIPAIIGSHRIAVEPHAADGKAIGPGTALATVRGELLSILAVERILLNIIGRLSGIATATHAFVQRIAGTRAVICDTRKTTPGLRNLEKYAVRCGGGTLHRLGLFDAALYKDNHLAGIPLGQLAARLRQAIGSLPRSGPDRPRFVEVEVDSLGQFGQVLPLAAEGLLDIVLLDNMAPAQLAQAVRMRDAAARLLLLEASGGVTLDTVRTIAETGVDRISVGAITHSAACLDVGLDLAADAPA